jgi:conserved domain protein
MNDELIGVKEVMEILKVSKSKGYSIMQNLNKELKKMGFYVISGRIPRQFLLEKFNISKK